MKNHKKAIRPLATALLLAGAAIGFAAPLQAQSAPFSTVERATAQPRVQFSAAERGKPILAGSHVAITGSGFHPGQSVTLLYGATPLTPDVLTANDKGEISGQMAIPADAAAGTHGIVVATGTPYQAFIADLKVSPEVPLSGAKDYRLTEMPTAKGLYQSAYSARNKALFVTAASGRPPVSQSELVKLDPRTLKVLARVTPAEVAEGKGVYAVYGVGVDDARDTVWVTNSRQATVAVYRQSDLGLVKQFPANTVPHARDVVIDTAAGKAYVGGIMSPKIYVFDTQTLDAPEQITIQSRQRGGQFSAASLSLDAKAHRLYVVSQTTNEVAVVDTAASKVDKLFAVPGARQAIGVSHDPLSGRIYVAAQGSDNLIVLDGADGKLVADTPVGAGALNVAFDPVKRRAYVATRAAGTIAVADADGKLLANLGPAPLANHVSVGDNGSVYAVDKSGNMTDGENDDVVLIQPRR